MSNSNNTLLHNYILFRDAITHCLALYSSNKRLPLGSA